MKKIMKYVLFIIFSIVLIIGFLTIMPKSTKLVKYGNEDIASKTNIDDIKGWDIPLDEVDFVILHGHIDGIGRQDYILTKEEAESIVLAINAIQKKDIYWNVDALTYGAPGPSFTIALKNGENIGFGLNPNGMYIFYKDAEYVTRYYLDIYDEVRNLADKYKLHWSDYEGFMSSCNQQIFMGETNDLIVDPDIKVIKAYTYINDEYPHLFKTLPLYGLRTFSDIIKPYKDELELNDFVETNDYIIKVVEIKDGEITAVAVSKK